MENNRNAILHEALTKGNASLFKNIPHTDLHCHSITSAPFDAFEKISPGVKPPPPNFASFNDFSAYLRDNIAPIVTNIDTIRYLTRAAFQRLIGEGVCYTEMSFDLTVPACLGIPFEDYIETINGEVERVKGNLTVCLEAGLDREIDPDQLLKLLRQAVRNAVFKSVDLYGNESANPIEKFAKIYNLAHKHGLKRKAHVGEFGTAEDIRKAIETLNLQGIQHGINAVQSPRLIRLIKNREITLNICPQSNLALGIIDDIKNHPIQKLLQEGVLVTVNSDDYSLFGKSVREELIRLYTNGVCSETEIAQIINNGLKQFHEYERGREQK